MFKKLVGFGLVGLAIASRALAVDPTTLDGFSDVGTAYIGKGTTIAIAAATLSLGWVAVRIVRKYTGKA